MHKILLTTLILFPTLMKAQTINRSDVVGTWTAIDGNITSTEIHADVKQMMLLMIDGFKESTWTFDENGTFRIKFTPNLPPVMKEIKFLDNKLWKFNDSSSQIQIGTREDNHNHLVLTAKQVDSGMNVYFSDTPVYLTLKKE